MDKIKEIIEKVKLWFNAAGFTSLAYLALFVATFLFGGSILGIIGFGFLAKYLAGAFIGIFCYVNWNVITKIWKGIIRPKIDEVIDKI